MIILKCKNCDGSLKIDYEKSIAICEYCGTKQTIPKNEIVAKQEPESKICKFINKKIIDKVLTTQTVTSFDTESRDVDALIERGYISLEMMEWESANALFNRALNLDSRNANAYLGKLLYDLKLKRTDDLHEVSVNIENNSNYVLALKFGDASLQSFLTNCNKKIIKNTEIRRARSKDAFIFDFFVYLALFVYTVAFFAMIDESDKLKNSFRIVKVDTYLSATGVLLVSEVVIFAFYLYFKTRQNKKITPHRSIKVTRNIAFIFMSTVSLISPIMSCAIVEKYFTDSERILAVFIHAGLIIVSSMCCIAWYIEEKKR